MAVSKCDGSDCERREQCWRYIAPTERFWQSWIAPEPAPCQNFMELPDWWNYEGPELDS